VNVWMTSTYRLGSFPKNEPTLQSFVSSGIKGTQYLIDGIKGTQYLVVYWAIRNLAIISFALPISVRFQARHETFVQTFHCLV